MNIWFVILVLATPIPVYFAQSRPTLGQKVFLIFVGTVVAHILLNLAFGTMWGETISMIQALETPSEDQMAQLKLATDRKTMFMFGAYLPSLVIVAIWWMIMKQLRRGSEQSA